MSIRRSTFEGGDIPINSTVPHWLALKNVMTAPGVTYVYYEPRCAGAGHANSLGAVEVGQLGRRTQYRWDIG